MAKKAPVRERHFTNRPYNIMLTLTSLFLFLGSLGMQELIVIFLIIIVLFGAKKIPELARGLGRGIREFKDASKEIKDEIEQGIKEEKK